MSKIKYADKRNQFIETYGESVYNEVIAAIRATGAPKNTHEKGRVFVEPDVISEPNSGGLRGRAYCYLNDFKDELVIDYMEMLNDFDGAGRTLIILMNFKSYPVG